MSDSSGTPSPAPGRAAAPSVPPRAAMPDLARGVMLLLIVLANIPWFLYAGERGLTLGHPLGAQGADRVVQALMIPLVDMRALPMFALLFGYGMVQFARAQEARGTPLLEFRAMLARRHVGLLVLGGVHAALLWFGDVLGVYGLLGLILVPLLFLRSTRAIRVVRGVLLGLLVLFAAGAIVGGVALMQVPPETWMIPATTDANAIASYPASILPRLSEWAFITSFSVVSLSVPAAILTGWLWARDGVLDRPAEHLPRLRRTALLGLPVAWLGGVPMMLTHLGLWVPVEISWMFMGLQSLTGLAGGLGYAALFALVVGQAQQRAERAGESWRPGPVASALSAVGRRSLSSYLWQSVAMAPLFAAWGLGLGGVLGSAAAAGVAILIWGVSVVGCAVLDRSGRTGPAEVVLRRFTYGSRDSMRSVASRV
ncbi:DUF418 domain-containing protein [Serinicoccus kebangsaanensis]|uniref:DUF418 domain-containing protein n=1 Tax=Serinicoccus kebangsaanensis TaxID=2602069 RepID=UPI00192D6837|nr:DUF418 domain-containing protein [Serinicoccus kebangsaanensis]